MPKLEIDLTDTEIAAIKELSDQKEMSVDSLIRQAIRLY